jgi:DNA-binding NtrC family response regulator
LRISDLDFGISPLWKAVLTRAERVARTPWPILLLGPRGSGKSVLARHIHDLSGRAGEFVLGPAPSIADSLLQSELLGHAKGAFTDAREERKGLLELAHGGTLFLDEIEAASYALQSLLVGQVEQPEVRRVGDARGRRVDVRFISASNADLRSLAGTPQFRADLFDRLSYLAVEVPALVQYREAILPLATQFLREQLLVLERDFAVEFSVSAKLLLLRFPWPGNLRQLRAVCTEVAINLTEERPVMPADFPAAMTAEPRQALDRDAQAILQHQVTTALQEAGGNKSKAARHLHMSRPSFLRTLERLNRTALGSERGRPA